jgi:hypothetical protein
MGTGASKAKREAKKQEAAAYYKALKKVERANPVERIDTQSARKLSDQLEGEMSYGSKRLAMKADKLGRVINADKTLNQNIESYNKRFDEVKRQMKGDTIKKYDVVPVSNNFMGIAGIGGGIGAGLNGQSALGKFDTKEAAMAAVPAPKKTSGMFGFNQESVTPISIAMGNQASPVKEVYLGPISGNYRQLSATKGAYKDLEQLSKNVSNTASAKLTKEYEALGNQLKAKLKRETGTMTGQPQGLLTTELASAAPKQEVIQ